MTARMVEEGPDQLGADASIPIRFVVHAHGLAACDGPVRVAGAAVARETRGLEIPEGRPDVACLRDIRVDPERRRAGLGRLLREHAATRAARRGARLLRGETQDINAPARRFYAHLGFRLRDVNPGACAAHPGRTQRIRARQPAPAIPAGGTGP